MPRLRLGPLLVTGALGFAAGRLLRSQPVRLARMSGSSIAAPSAAGWVTDFLNAAYYARPLQTRQVDDLRLAFMVLTTYWWQQRYRRLELWDVAAFHRAFGRERFGAHPRGTLDRERLVAGGARLLGDWFPGAIADHARRGWGIVFPSSADKAAYQPEQRLRHAVLGPLTPPSAPLDQQVWHTYPPVPVPSAERVVAALTRVEAWPDYGSEIGRFTPVRRGGLDGQTFEIEVAGNARRRAPLFLRGYVTITRLVTAADTGALHSYVDDLNAQMDQFGRGQPQPVPDGAEPLVAFDLTTHEGHFMGNARNRLLLFTQDGQAYLRAAGTWDPMPWHLDELYVRAGRHEQHAFWGMETPEESMLHQIALAVT